MPSPLNDPGENNCFPEVENGGSNDGNPGEKGDDKVTNVTSAVRAGLGSKGLPGVEVRPVFVPREGAPQEPFGE